jgi:hypothetical protein
MALRKNEYYTEVNGVILIVKKLKENDLRDRQYTYFRIENPNPIIVLRSSIEVFKTKIEAKKYFK